MTDDLLRIAQGTVAAAERAVREALRDVQVSDHWLAYLYVHLDRARRTYADLIRIPAS